MVIFRSRRRLVAHELPGNLHPLAAAPRSERLAAEYTLRIQPATEHGHHMLADTQPHDRLFQRAGFPMCDWREIRDRGGHLKVELICPVADRAKLPQQPLARHTP